ncbi:AAA family ATPase [Chitinophaga niabensis]|uniref:AAA family ATPase n=1 Tax=Chitinophaga niabensis TaxID=536979 RepID=UPI0031BB85A7
MKITLITGMSATGKSTVIRDLVSRGHKAIDLDTEAFSVWVDATGDDDEVKPGKDWVWNEPRVLELLQHKEPLFVSGCASNMAKFYPYFDHIILLTAPDAVIVQRLSQRQGNAYGQSPEEAERVLRLKQVIEPLLREDADLEIDTSVADQSAAELILRHTE